MTINPRVAALVPEVTTWRRDFHENPEILYEVHRTAKIVAEKLKAFGCDEVVPGVGKTGVVGIIKGKKTTSNRVIGLRADMDALPIHEQTNLAYASKTPGKMHACGHDGHTATLLGAAKYLSETRDFDGTAVVIFQPAEEGGAGGKAMVDDGMMDRWNIQEVYGMHNNPGQPVGTFATRPGPLLAASDHLHVTIEGKGGHAAKPHLGVDPVVVGAHIILALQSIASRNVDPLDSSIISMCQFNAGHAMNVIPQTAELAGTARSLTPHVRDLLEKRFVEICETTARAYGAVAKATYTRSYPVTKNHAKQTQFSVDVASKVFGAQQVDANVTPVMGGEDFSYMLEARPGAFIFYGNGDTAPVHHPAYDFNDKAIAPAITMFARLIEEAMPAR